MNYVLALIFALFMTIGWQSTVLAADDGSSSTSTETTTAEGQGKGEGEEEPECD
jgi:hypothetical protein